MMMLLRNPFQALNPDEEEDKPEMIETSTIPADKPPEGKNNSSCFCEKEKIANVTRVK